MREKEVEERTHGQTECCSRSFQVGYSVVIETEFRREESKPEKVWFLFKMPVLPGQVFSCSHLL